MGLPRRGAATKWRPLALWRGIGWSPKVGRNEWYGALAQLGERLHGMQEVSGSIPLGSTIRKTRVLDFHAG